MEQKGFITNLREGNFGLGTTYWLYFVIGGNVIGGTIAFAVPILLLIWIPYMVIVLMGVWNSAKKYTGSSIWSGLAQLIVVLNFLMIFVVIMGLFGSHNHNSYEQYNYQSTSSSYRY